MSEILAKFDGVVGESSIKGYEGWIEINSWQEGLFSPVNKDGTGLSGGKSQLSSMSFQANGGKHTPDIIKKGTGGKHFAKVEIHFLKQTGDKLEKFKTSTCEEVFVGSWQGGDHKGGDGSESFSMDATRVTWEYFAQDGTGALASVGTATYDQKTGATT